MSTMSNDLNVTDPTVAQLIRDSKVIVCCGAGGVGKTTTAGAVAVAGARLGRKVLVLTIDPSKRLAETLGVERNPPEPVSLSPERLAAVGVAAGTTLDAWMVDPKRVADDAVRRIVRTDAEIEKLFQNRIYQHVTTMVAGMHEYTAMHALYTFVKEGRYDLVVLDTPPSRHALDFLEAPGRIARFLDGRVFKMFMPSEVTRGMGGLRRAAGSLVHKVLNSVLGDQLASDLAVFFGVFAGVLSTVTRDVTEMRGFLSGADVSFLLVTSPAPAALEEALFFQAKTADMQLPFKGFILNRSMLASGLSPLPQGTAANASGALASALPKLEKLAQGELRTIDRHQELLVDLKRRAGAGHLALALPSLERGEFEDELKKLGTLATCLLNA